jgi:integrase/recombinase XerD
MLFQIAATRAAKEETMENYSFEKVMEGVHSAGCVQPYIQGFVEPLLNDGYSLLCTRDYARSASHLGRWMENHGLEIEDLTEPHIAKFSRHRCKCPGVGAAGRQLSRRYLRRVRRFVDYLRQVEILPVKSVPAVPDESHSLDDYCNWMQRQCGLAERTISRYNRLVSEMLPQLGADPSSYEAALVRRVLLDHIRGKGTVYAQSYVTALRSYLKYLSGTGQCTPGLNHAVPTIPHWKLSNLPRYLVPEDVERVIDACDLNKPHGIRDQAIILLLARLGLRAGDIVSMRLDDLNWKAGTLKVYGKNRKEVILPLAQDAGDAVIRYLVDARPTTDIDTVFLCANAPIRPLARSATVSSVVMLALRRAGIDDAPSSGAHLLRHSAATAMIRSGVSYDAVATMLRHQSIDMTAYYAKVDVKLLQQVAQPWPEVE